MELNNIKRIVDFSDDFKPSDYPYVMERVNSYLAAGWVLIETYKSSNGDIECPGQSIHYILGTDTVEE